MKKLAALGAAGVIAAGGLAAEKFGFDIPGIPNIFGGDSHAEKPDFEYAVDSALTNVTNKFDQTLLYGDIKSSGGYRSRPVDHVPYWKIIANGVINHAKDEGAYVAQKGQVIVLLGQGAMKFSAKKDPTNKKYGISLVAEVNADNLFTKLVSSEPQLDKNGTPIAANPDDYAREIGELISGDDDAVKTSVAINLVNNHMKYVCNDPLRMAIPETVKKLASLKLEEAADTTKLVAGGVKASEILRNLAKTVKVEYYKGASTSDRGTTSKGTQIAESEITLPQEPKKGEGRESLEASVAKKVGVDDDEVTIQLESKCTATKEALDDLNRIAGKDLAQEAAERLEN